MIFTAIWNVLQSKFEESPLIALCKYINMHMQACHLYFLKFQNLISGTIYLLGLLVYYQRLVVKVWNMFIYSIICWIIGHTIHFTACDPSLQKDQPVWSISTWTFIYSSGRIQTNILVSANSKFVRTWKHLSVCFCVFFQVFWIKNSNCK